MTKFTPQRPPGPPLPLSSKEELQDLCIALDASQKHASNLLRRLREFGDRQLSEYCEQLWEDVCRLYQDAPERDSGFTGVPERAADASFSSVIGMPNRPNVLECEVFWPSYDDYNRDNDTACWRFDVEILFSLEKRAAYLEEISQRLRQLREEKVRQENEQIERQIKLMQAEINELRSKKK